MKVTPEMAGDPASRRRAGAYPVPGFSRRFPKRNRRRPGTSRVAPFERQYPLRGSLFGNVVPKQDALFTKYPEMMGNSVTKKGKSMKKRKRKRKKSRRKKSGMRGIGQITTSIPKALKTTISEDVLKGVGAGFLGSIAGRLAGGFLAGKLPVGTPAGTARLALNGVTAIVGSVTGILIGNVLFKSPSAGKMAAAGALLIGVDGMVGDYIPALVGFKPVSGYIDGMGQLRLPEDVEIAGQVAGLDQLRLPEDVDMGQYDDMDQVVEEEELLGLGDDDDSPF